MDGDGTTPRDEGRLQEPLMTGPAPVRGAPNADAPAPAPNVYSDDGGDEEGEEESPHEGDRSALIQMDTTEVEALPGRGGKQGPVKRALGAVHRLFNLFPVQVIMVLLTLVDVGFLIYEFAASSTRFEAVTLCTAFSFFFELVIHMAYLGPRRFFAFDTPWMVAEALIVTTSFAVELTEFTLQHTVPESFVHRYVRYMRAVRCFRVLILWKTRSRKMAAAVRRLVSADRRRFQEDGYDLDLTYVHHNVIAMSWPSSKVESFYRNHIDVVSRFLDDRHGRDYRVFNLCSERRYDESKFHGLVSRYRLDDHNPGELGLLLEFARECRDHIAADPATRVVVIHCKGGKGRTGTMVCVHMIYSGLARNADEALQRFGAERTSDGAKTFQGVESPSQGRYVRYFDRLMRLPGEQAPLRLVKLRRLRFENLPARLWDVGRLWLALVTKPNTDRTLHYITDPFVQFDPRLPQAVAGDPLDGTTSSARMRSDTIVESPTGAFDSGSFDNAADIFYDGKTVCVLDRNTPGAAERRMDATAFVAEFVTPHVRGKEGVPEAFAKRYAVSVEFDTKEIDHLSGDVNLKVFHNANKPNPLKAPIQIWFHTSFERDTMVLRKRDVDGPHKDKKHKKYPADFGCVIDMETVAGEGAP